MSKLGGFPNDEHKDEMSKKEALIQAVARIQELEALAERQHGKLDQAQGRITELEAENKKIRTENQTLKDTLEAWQAVVRVAREKDSTLPDPESPL